MIRRPLTFAAFLSLLLCAATIVVWVRSCRVNDVFWWFSSDPNTLRFNVGELVLRDGIIGIEIDHTRLETRQAFQLTVADWQHSLQSTSPLVHITFPPTPEPRHAGSVLTRLGFWVESTHDRIREEDFSAWRWIFWKGELKRVPVHRVGGYSSDASLVTFPAWFIALLLFLPALRVVRAMRRRTRERRRRRDGACLQCGYSLIGNTGGVCPECGRAIAPTAERVAKPPSGYSEGCLC